MKHTFSLLAKGLLCFLASVTAASMTAAGTASAPGLSATTEEIGTATNLPENGKTYYIYCDNNTQQFFYNNGGALAVTNGITKDISLYTFTCTVTAGGKYQLKNVSNNKYFGFRGFSNSAYNLTITDGYPTGVATHIYCDAAGKYLVMKNDGRFDQADNANYTKDDNNAFSANYVFVDVETGKLLTISGNANAGATITWNGETKPLPCTFLTLPTTEITDNTLTLTKDDAALSAATLKYEGVFNTRGEEVTLPATYDGTENATYEVRFMPDVFSSTLGEKWVRVANVRKQGYGFTLPGNTAGQIATRTIDVSSLDHVWCFVGNYKSFKIYSHTEGNQVITHDGSPAEDEAVTLTAANEASTAQSWTLADYTSAASNPGYSIEAVGTPGQGLNPHGGINNDLKFYRSSDAGCRWVFPVVDTEHPVTLTVNVEGTSFENNPVADITISTNGTNLSYPIRQTAENPTGSVETQQIYLYKDRTFTASSFTYRGFNSETLLNGEPSSLTNLTPASSPILTFNYRANEDRIIFTSPDANGYPYRIPAIATALNGDVMAVADNRPCRSDIGYGEVDIKVRVSKDNGATWGTEEFIANGDGDEARLTDGDKTNDFAYAFGDAAIVADRERNEVVVFSVAGKTVCHNGNYTLDPSTSNPNRVARMKGTYNEASGTWSWSTPEEVTEKFYAPFVKETSTTNEETGEITTTRTVTVQSLFIGSGRIMQSRVVKKDQYYRLYAALWTKNQGNRVVYSDDFGENWHILGTVDDRPASSGDEPKCEELPNGTVVLSSRKGSGRYFNLFTFDSTTGDDAYTTGTWGTVVSSNNVTGGFSNSDSGTNGEIFMLDNVMDNTTGVKKTIMLHSVPLGSGRNNVAIWYKEIDPSVTYTPETFATGWTLGKQVSFRGSAYSTMTLQKDNRIGFLFEEVPNGYCIIYCPLTIEEITGGAYDLYTDANRKRVAVNQAEEVLAIRGVGYPTTDNAARATLQEAINAAQSSSAAIDEVLSTLNTAVTTYKATKTDIQLPEDGKAYTFTHVTLDGVKQPMTYGANEMTCNASNIPTVFVCRKLDNGKYIFVCNEGKYLSWKGSSGGINNNKGYVNSYDAASGSYTDWSNITIEKMVKGGFVTYGEQADYFGYMTIAARRTTSYEKGYLILNHAAYDNSNSPYFQTSGSNSYSSAFLIEEAAYPNNVALSEITAEDTYIKGIETGRTICTFSAPFPTVIPENVSAYYALNTDNGAKMKRITTPAIPANQGVILIGPNGFNTGLMLPAAGEEEAELTNVNLFAHTAGAAHELVEGDYILAKGTAGLAFYKGRPGTSLRMNRAYLPAALTLSAERGVALRFGDDTTTDIDQIVTDESNEINAPVFDLTGRRINKLRKGGLYISNGKKFIAR